MKLSIITEDIAQKEFYDFYALLHAATDGHHPNQDEIKQRLDFISEVMVNDLLRQLGNIILGRILNSDDKNTKTMMDKANLQYDDKGYSLPGHGVDDIDNKTKCVMMAHIIKNQKHFGFTGETWYDLARTYIELCGEQKSSLKSRILLIDKIYNLLHHGGMITDYMEEHRWLEDALNTRDSANPRQILNLASRGIRSLIGSSTYIGQPAHNVSDIDKLYTSFRRYIIDKDGIEVLKNGENLEVTGRYRPIWYVDGKFKMLANIMWGNKHTKHQSSLVKNDKIVVGDEHIGHVVVSNNDQFFSVKGTAGVVEIEKKKKFGTSYHDICYKILLHVTKCGDLNKVSN